jgi:hypothetical protein
LFGPLVNYSHKKFYNIGPWGVVVVRHVVDHLDNVQDPHQGLLHLARILQVDGVAGLLDGPQELGVVRRLDVVLGDPLVDVVPHFQNFRLNNVAILDRVHNIGSNEKCYFDILSIQMSSYLSIKVSG